MALLNETVLRAGPVPAANLTRLVNGSESGEASDR